MTDTEQTSTALARRPLTQSDWQMIQAVSPAAAASKFFASVLKPEQAAMIMLKGHELGLPLSASFEYIHIIENKPSLSPMGALAILRRSGELEHISVIEIDQPAGAMVTMKRRSTGEEFTITWTVEDARLAGLVDPSKPKSGWNRYPKNLCRWRAIGFCADFLFPDLLGGLKRSDELGAEVTESGEVIDAQWTPMAISQEAPAAAPAPVAVGPTLDELLAQYGADAVMAAAGGGIPSTNKELADVAATLAKAVPA